MALLIAIWIELIELALNTLLNGFDRMNTRKSKVNVTGFTGTMKRALFRLEIYFQIIAISPGIVFI